MIEFKKGMKLRYKSPRPNVLVCVKAVEHRPYNPALLHIIFLTGQHTGMEMWLNATNFETIEVDNEKV